jgi:hypothetical protein
MPVLSIASDLGLTTPQTAAQRPFILYCGGADILNSCTIDSYSLDDADLTQPGIFTVVVTDPNNTVGRYIHKLDEIMWVETIPDRMLYRGFVRQIDVTPIANYAQWTLTCSDLSEMLDYGLPIVTDARPAETTTARVQHILGMFGTASSMGTGGFISSFSSTVQPAMAFQRETVRTALEKAIGIEATASTAYSYYLDYFYRMHIFAGLGDVAAPYDLSDTPNNVTTVSYGPLTASFDATADTDQMYVYGNSAAGSGTASLGIPRAPARVSFVDASASTTPATAQTAGLAALAQRQGVTRVQVTVTGWDGWAKGQSVHVTNQILGWSGVTFWIAGVSMRTLSPRGYREYTLQLNASLPRMSRILAASRASGPVLGQTIQGQLGGS